MGLFGSLFGKSHKAKNQQLPTINPQQSALMNQILSQLGGPMGQGISNLGQLLSNDPSAMEQFNAPYMRQFEEEIVPGLAERFAGMGSGAQGSSAFGQSLSSAGSGLEEMLASLRGDQQNQAFQSLIGLYGTSMGIQPFQNMYTPASRSSGILGGALPGMIGMGGKMGLGKMFGMF